MMKQGATGTQSEVASSAELPCILFPPFRLDPEREQLWRESELIALKPKAFAILRYLLDRPQRLISKSELLGNLWGDVHVNAAVLKTHLRDIRIALGDAVKSPRYIETAPRRGYRFIAAVSRERVVRELPAASTALDGVPHFVGRQAELDRLNAAWAEANLGRRQLVFVSGPPGIGKTSLVRAFLGPFAKEGAVVAWGQCVAQHGSGEAYLAVLEALSRLSQGPEAPNLLTAFSRRGPSWTARLPALGELGAASLIGDAPGAALPDSIMRELAEALEHFTQERPLLLLIEDAHCADPSTVTWLSYWARRTDFARMLVLCTHRPIDADEVPPTLPTLRRELHRLSHCSDLQLSDLSRSEVVRYFETRFTGFRLPPALMSLVNERVGGNPLFLVRAVDSWIEQGLLTHVTGRWELTVDIERITSSTPESVVSLIEREYETLDDFERRVLEAASVAGKTFSVAAVAAALEEDVVRVEALCLHWARRRQFLVRLGRERWPDGSVATLFEFIHALYQEIGYRDVGAARQAQLHRRIAERLETAYGGRAHEVAGALALHFERGQDSERAVNYLTSAGEQSYTAGAYREAAGHFGRALPLLQQLWGAGTDGDTDVTFSRTELTLQLGFGTAMALTRGYGVPEALASFTRARDLCDSSAPTLELFQALMGLGTYHIVSGAYAEAKTLADEFSDLCEVRPDAAIRAQVCLMAGVSRLFEGELLAARAYLEQTLALHDPEQQRPKKTLMDTGVAAHSFLGLTLWLLGEPALATAAVTQALVLGARQPVLHAECMAINYASLVFGLCGDLEESRKQAERGMKLSAHYDLALCGQTVRLHWGAVCIAQGELELGIGVISEALAAAEDSGARLGVSAWHWMLAEANAALGRVDEALRQLGHAFSRVQAAGERWWEPELYRTLGTVLLREGASADLPVACRVALAGGAASPTWCFAHALTLSGAMQARALELRVRQTLAFFSPAQAPASAPLHNEA